MSFYINTDHIEDVAVLECAGRMVHAQALSLLKDAVTGLPQARVIVVDISGVTMLDARGLGVLVSLHNWSCARGIQMRLVNPSKLVRQMLLATGLTSVLHVSSFDDVIHIFCGADRPIESVAGAVA